MPKSVPSGTLENAAIIVFQHILIRPFQKACAYEIFHRLYEWEGIKYLVDTLSLNYHYHVADCNKTPKELGNMASAYIKEKHPALVAICYDGPDHTGHTEGHDTPAYYEKLKELDIYVGQIVQAVKDAGILDDTIFI